MTRQSGEYAPEHCPTCRCEPVGPLPADVPVDPYCPEHGSRPTAYADCSCFRTAARRNPPEKRALMTQPHDGHPDTEVCPGCPHD